MLRILIALLLVGITGTAQMPIGALKKSGKDTLMYTGTNWIKASSTAVHLDLYPPIHTHPALGQYIDSIEWLCLVDSDMLVISRTIPSMVRDPRNNTWTSGRWYPTSPTGMINIEYVEGLGYRCLTKIHWYFCQRKGSESVIINPKP